MEYGLTEIEQQLKTAVEQCDPVIAAKTFCYEDWMKKKELLFPVVEKLQSCVKENYRICEQTIRDKQKKQEETIELRTELYQRLEEERRQISELELEQIQISTKIKGLADEIEELQCKITDLQNRIKQAKKDKKYWNTVFWATCWLPFVDIGTGVKKGYEDGKYQAKVNMYTGEISKKRQEIDNLMEQKKDIAEQQKESQKCYEELNNQVDETGKKVKKVTGELNIIRGEIALWYKSVEICGEIEVRLNYADGNPQKVSGCFSDLVKICNQMAEILD